MTFPSELLEQVAQTAKQAGQAIMEIYNKDFSVYEKSDSSPLTDADLAAHEVIVAGLKSYSDLPILSEESADIAWEERKSWEQFWLVDPLDGTKEFIKKNGEFTVNIALIDKGQPVMGVVYAPVLDTLYIASEEGAYKVTSEGKQAIKAVVRSDNEVCKVVGSRSHQSPDIAAFLANIQGETEMLSMGSSLKLCLVAEGQAHLYPRLGPTSEWDTAAAHAIVRAAGGKVTILNKGSDAESSYVDSGEPLLYNQKESILNPYFLVSA